MTKEKRKRGERDRKLIQILDPLTKSKRAARKEG